MADGSTADDYPLFQMVTREDEGEKQTWLPLQRAGVLYDSGWVQVRIGGLVLEGPGEARKITEDERKAIARIALEYSESK